jgi:CheY-like chemotaxis protein
MDAATEQDGISMNIAALCGRRILVVEDQQAIALDLCETLGQEGVLIVGPACSVEDALSIIESAGPLDAAVLDIELEGEPVYAVADRLQQLGVPYLFTTGYEATEIPDRYRLAPRFEKPVGTGAILDALRDQMSRHTTA